MNDVRAVVLSGYGDVTVLQEASISLPALQADELLVKVSSAGVSPFDLHVRDGWFKESIPYQEPIVLGWEISGDIAQVGDAVAGFSIGDSVVAHPNVYHNGGGYAEYVILKTSEVAHKPVDVSHDAAAAVSMNGLTAWQALFTTANLTKGQRVLIHAAAGGVGHLAVQLAKWAGAYVIGTASETNHDYLKKLGCDELIDYQQQDFQTALTDKVDVVFDTIGKETLLKSFEVLKPGGMAVSITDFENIKKAEKYHVTAEAIVVEPNQTQLTKLMTLIQEKHITPEIYRTFPLASTKEAQQLLEQGHLRGKIILHP